MKALKTFKKHMENKYNPNRNILTVATWLPVFTGYYETIFDESDSAYEYINSLDVDEYADYFPKLFNAGVSLEYLKNEFWYYADFTECFNDASESICDAITSLDSCGILLGSEYEKMCSPKYYNFSNDSINCKLTFNVKKLKQYIMKNIEAYAEYIGVRYTSRDGFSSWYSNDVNDWLDFKDLGAHGCGSVLQFVLQNENEDPTLDLYYAADVACCFYNYDLDENKLIEDFKTKQAKGA